MNAIPLNIKCFPDLNGMPDTQSCHFVSKSDKFLAPSEDDVTKSEEFLTPSEDDVSKSEKFTARIKINNKLK
jgi:hypothetical protein